MWRRAGYLDPLPGHRHLLFDHRGHGRSDKPRELDAHVVSPRLSVVSAPYPPARAWTPPRRVEEGKTAIDSDGTGQLRRAIGEAGIRQQL
jgi:pimeloyl-ACP methyl ester carboxylesterase